MVILILLADRGITHNIGIVLSLSFLVNITIATATAIASATAIIIAIAGLAVEVELQGGLRRLPVVEHGHPAPAHGPPQQRQEIRLLCDK